MLMELSMPDTGRIAACLALSGGSVVGVQRLTLRLTAPVHEDGAAFMSRGGDVVALLAGMQVGCCFLLLTARPLLSLACTLSLLLLLARLNLVKEKTLREPLILADARLLPQGFRHPSLYLPFLPIRILLAGFAGFVALCVVLLHLENPIAWRGNSPLLAFCLITAFLPLAVAVLLRLGRLSPLARFLLHVCPVSHDAAADAVRCGALAAALMHPVQAGRMEYGDLRDTADFLREHTLRPVSSRFAPAFERMLRATASTHPAARSHVVLVQAESFCDIRKHLSGAQREALRDFLPDWDRLRQSGQALSTPENAFGAYSMRTEFSMLTGLQPETLSPWALNPYLLASRRPLWSLAWFFRDLGYEALCIHPYHKRFFGRDKVMPNLGFQRFLSIEELGEMERFGPYVSDAALGRRILEELEEARRPVFCFAVTMEAHGPWLEGRLTEQEIAETLHDVDVDLFSPEMRRYLCHLRHMDALFEMLLDAREEGRCGRDVEVWAYGDHAPGVD
jgi:phosphoglycerol transferase MdoB-like AlkP superfamily enzyme